MITVIALIGDMPGTPFESRKAFERAVKRHVYRKTGEEPRKAIYDDAGNCIVCGECGRCPGWHTLQEFNAQEAQKR